MSIRTVVEKDTIRLPHGMHVPDGTTVLVILQPDEPPTLAVRYASLIGITDSLPEDMAENHDHYLHGRPKI